MSALARVTKTSIRRLHTRQLSSYIRLSPRVSEALKNREPVVALESTIISHGMPYPQNVATAQQVEKIVSEYGSVPATIALIDGKIHVGLTNDELERLGKSGKAAVKTSRRDMAAVLSQKVLGATTVSATMIAAHMAGIAIFATGGIGGVHRGAESTMDISADLTELGKTPVTVVCAGAKSILDLPKTLEFLETQGVPVVAYGESSEFPAFFSPRSGLRAPWNMQTPEEVARMTKTALELGLQTGQVIAVPIPDAFAKQSAEIELAIERAVGEAAEQGITGKESTPFLLKRVVELTAGASLTANIALVKNNARVGSQIAASLASMMPGSFGARRSYSTAARRLKHSGKHGTRPLVVVGGSAIDVMSRIDSSFESMPITSSSYPGAVHTSVGGVGQNMARAAHYLGADTVLISAIGHDTYGTTVKTALDDIGMNTAFLQYPSDSARTAVYNAIHKPDGDLLAAVADMEINGMVSAQQIEEAFRKLAPGVVALDGNISVLAISNSIVWSYLYKSCVVFEPTSVPKSSALLNALSFIKRSGSISDIASRVHIITPNSLELARMAAVALELALVETAPLADTVKGYADALYSLRAEDIGHALTLFPLFPIQVVKLGEKGVMLVSPSSNDRTKPLIRHIRPRKPSLVINSNGAGDSLVGAVLASLSKLPVKIDSEGCVEVDPETLDRIVDRAQKASILSLESANAISEKLEPALLEED
ncbi:hypothetical protein FBU59_001876 [Linderina macrospora]|uniref:Uncharacterized protein n=1 Tax=Linderina macrospora TaxID=4868 RepID=A0ACC1JCY3_9FUNG|nr:hypothetical protein FBU59_001876 [Linderina macrospora]